MVKKKARPKKKKLTLAYKVVELSSVDEHTLERTLNEWCPQGFRFDGVQFAMRESSKRPAMAFVFFTREQAAVALPGAPSERPRSQEDAFTRLMQLASGGDE